MDSHHCSVLALELSIASHRQMLARRCRTGARTAQAHSRLERKLGIGEAAVTTSRRGATTHYTGYAEHAPNSFAVPLLCMLACSKLAVYVFQILTSRSSAFSGVLFITLHNKISVNYIRNIIHQTAYISIN